MDSSRFSDKVKPICSTILDLPPSSIEFSPSVPEYFVVGTYNLQKEIDTGSAPQSRTGSVNLFRIVGDNLGFETQVGQERTLIQTLSHPSAILDLHFSPHSPELFAVASSTGTVSIYRLKAGKISHLVRHQAFDHSLLVLSFTWCPSLNSESSPLIAVTLSDGSVRLLLLDSKLEHLNVLTDGEPINAHDLEAWTCAFAIPKKEDGTIKVYSGGDDGQLRLVELQSLPKLDDCKIATTQTLPQNVFRGHEAGVTAILPLPVRKVSGESSGLGDILLTGSYDDHVRVYTTYDERLDQRRTGKVLAEFKIGGGVWRLKFLDDPPLQSKAGMEVSIRVLASCMHAGARVLEVKRDSGGEWGIEILGSVTVHESMCYGSDVQPVDGSQGERLCVSTSFYDRLLCVWRFEHNAV